MKPFFKKTIYLSAIFIIIGLIFLGYTYTAGNLKSFVAKELEKSFGAKLSIAHMRMSFPLCLQLKGVKINDAAPISPAERLFAPILYFAPLGILIPVNVFATPVWPAILR